MKTGYVKRIAAVGMSAMMLTISAPLRGIPAQAADDSIRDFSLGDITMTDAYSVNAFNKEINYLLAFDDNKLLAGFRENAGLNTRGATRYGGWENTNIA
ncbi:MAG: hypothetical protein IKP25_08170, partial [Ruminococcus sp.]|nr:hypothetical protein [Ruminococcus sp.]